MGLRNPGLHLRLISKVYLEGPEWSQREVNDFRVTGDSWGRPGPGKREEGMTEMGANGWTPRAKRTPNKGGCGQGRALQLCVSQGTPFASPERVSLLTQLVELRSLENLKGKVGEGRHLAAS